MESFDVGHNMQQGLMIPSPRPDILPEDAAAAQIALMQRFMENLGLRVNYIRKLSKGRDFIYTAVQLLRADGVIVGHDGYPMGDEFPGVTQAHYNHASFFEAAFRVHPSLLNALIYYADGGFQWLPAPKLVAELQHSINQAWMDIRVSNT